MPSRKATIHLIAGCNGAGKTTFALEYLPKEVGQTYLRLLRQARRAGFRIHIHYLWLPTVALALRRIRERVRKGGHNVPAADVRRRFTRSLRHFVDDYAPLAQRWAVWDNQTSPPRLLADSKTCPLGDLRRMLLAQ